MAPCAVRPWLSRHDGETKRVTEFLLGIVCVPAIGNLQALKASAWYDLPDLGRALVLNTSAYTKHLLLLLLLPLLKF
jgi:hypothetical protein